MRLMFLTGSAEYGGANPFVDELCPLYRALCARATNQRIARV